MVKARNVILSLVLPTLLVGCDPIYSVKRTITFDGAISNECIEMAANSLGSEIFVKKIEDKYGAGDFDEFIVSDGKAEIDILWYRSNRQQLEIGSLGIGYADRERDEAICNLIAAFHKSLLSKCSLDPNLVTFKDEYVRSKCTGTTI